MPAIAPLWALALNTEVNTMIRILTVLFVPSLIITLGSSATEKTEILDELDKPKSTTVVQNITYNIQDSAIAGDINATGLKEKDD